MLTELRPRRGLNTFGTSLTYTAAAQVIVTVDRSQWYMDIAPTPGAKTHFFDILLAASSGRPYWECLPPLPLRDWRMPLPKQLPPGVAWRDTLPAVLAWLASEADIAAAVRLAKDQRVVALFPETSKAKKLRRAWRANGEPLP